MFGKMKLASPPKDLDIQSTDGDPALNRRYFFTVNGSIFNADHVTRVTLDDVSENPAVNPWAMTIWLSDGGRTIVKFPDRKTAKHAADYILFLLGGPGNETV